VEAALYKVVFEGQGQGGKQAYKERCRDLVSNLKANEALKARLLVGGLSAEALLGLSSEDMASEDLRRERDLLLAESLKESQIDQSTGRTLTDEYKCPECGMHETQYTLIAARRSHAKCDTWGKKDDDEGSLAQMHCVPCGHAWTQVV
jgi:DNA-directed RNA polymerase subunit M/transcription elongation factor TFIIS